MPDTAHIVAGDVPFSHVAPSYPITVHHPWHHGASGVDQAVIHWRYGRGYGGYGRGYGRGYGSGVL